MIPSHSEVTAMLFIFFYNFDHWNHYFEHTDLHFPANNPVPLQQSSHGGFHTRAAFSSPFSQPYPASPSQTTAHDGVTNTTENPDGGNGPFPLFFRVCFFRLDSWSPSQRGPVRGTPGRLPATESRYQERSHGGEEAERGCAGHGSPGHGKGEEMKTRMPNEFRFSLL